MDLAICLEKMGLSSYYWGPDVSSYETLAKNWPSNNPPLPSEELFNQAWQELEIKTEWEKIRKSRNKLLSESDWTQVQDATCDKLAWLEYRKNLRNIPQVYLSPFDVVWPVPPS